MKRVMIIKCIENKSKNCLNLMKTVWTEKKRKLFDDENNDKRPKEISKQLLKCKSIE